MIEKGRPFGLPFLSLICYQELFLVIKERAFTILAKTCLG